MSSGQKQYNQEMQQETQAANAQLNTETANMQQDDASTAWLRGIASSGANWIAAKNYAAPPPGLFNYDLSDPAKREQQREADMNLQSTGADALGAQNANPQALAMARQELNDQNDQDNAANYQKSVGQYMGQIEGMNSDLASYDFTKDNALLGDAYSRYNTASTNWGKSANTPSPWAQIAGAALGTAGGLGTAWINNNSGG